MALHSDLREPVRNLGVLFIRRTGSADQLFGDLTPIAQLVKLTKLTMRETPISDIGLLGNLVLLDELSLPNNAVSDLRPLAGLTRLEFLNLASNRVVDLARRMGESS